MRPSRRILWLNVMTVASAAILIGAEVFGAAFAGTWAIATLFSSVSSSPTRSTPSLRLGLIVMVSYALAARIEPFIS